MHQSQLIHYLKETSLIRCIILLLLHIEYLYPKKSIITFVVCYAYSICTTVSRLCNNRALAVECMRF